MFTRGQRVYTPEFGFVKFERQLVSEPAFSYVIHKGGFQRVSTETITANRYNQSAADELVPFVQSVYITCGPDAIDGLADVISENSSISSINAVDYVKPSPRGHGAKFDIGVKSDTPLDLIQRLGVPLDSRPLALWLMKEHNVVPVKHV